MYGAIIALEVLVLIGSLGFEASFWMHRSTSLHDFSSPASVAPQNLPALERITQDILTEPNSLVTFAAGSQHNTLGPVRMIMQPIDPNGDPVANLWSCPVAGVSNPTEGTTRYSIQRFLETPQHHRYRFESATAVTAWSDLTVSARPQVQSIRAQTRQPQQTWNESTWIPIEHRRLEVVQGSQVALHLQADQSLSQIQVHQDGKLIETLTPEGCQASYECLPETSQALTFTPINEMGQAVEEPLYLELEVKTDQKPYFELREPEKDLPLATPAAVTVTFLVCDDIGLDRVALCYEVKDSPMVCLEEPITPPVKEVTLTRTLPLDQWNLEEGDTVMFYATARDTPLDPNIVRPEAYSEIYLIEIQREVQIKPSSKSTTPNAVETLMDALAYLRAIIKKTWNLSHTTPWTPLQEELLHLLTLDLTHTMEIIASHRDDEQKNYGPQDTAILYQVNATLTEALDALKTLRLTEAMESEKHGYRLLRDLLQEQDRTPDRSPSSPPSITPEKLEIPFEPNQPSAMSEQQAQQQLNTIQKQLESLIQQQRQVNSASNQTSPSSTNDSPSVSPHEASQRMRHDMMMAQQQALRSQADQIQTALDQVSQRSSGQEQQSSQQASQHMQQAVEAMNAIQPERDDVHVTLNEVQEQLMQAEAALDQSLRDKQTDPQIKQAQRLIEQLMQDVQALNQNPQPTHTKNIQKHLQQAGQLLRSMESSQTSAGQSVPLNWDMPTTWVLPDYSLPPSPGPMREMIQRLWTATMSASQNQGRAVKMPSSVGQFWELENAFFERTSRYSGGGTKP